MENESKAYQIGQRLRKARNARGWTQEVLAEKCNVTPQTISKYEKSGLSDVDTVTSLSNVLGTDLWTDEFDSESPVSEIGMEILIQLIKAGGCLPFEELITDHLLGLDRARATDEIVKLFNGGLAIRERYKDLFDNEFDNLFITAKGVITCRHRISNPLISSEISSSPNKLLTYENRLVDDIGLHIDPAESMQDYYDKRSYFNIIRDLPYVSYRCNEIIYLKKYFSYSNQDAGYDFRTRSSLFLGLGFRFDLIHSILMGLTKNNVVDIISNLYDSNIGYWEYDILNRNLQNMSDEERKKELSHYSGPTSDLENLKMLDSIEIEPSYGLSLGSRYFGLYKGLDNDLFFDPAQEKEAEEAYESIYENMSVTERMIDYEQHEHVSSYIQRMFDSTYHNKPKVYPEKLFTDEELYNYAKENLRPACTEIERKVDKMILEINKLLPETLQYYNACTDKMLDLVEELYGTDISTVKEKYRGYIDIPNYYPEHVSDFFSPLFFQSKDLRFGNYPDFVVRY